MKGYRTLIFNLIMVIVGLTGAELSPETAKKTAEAFVTLWGAGNIVLRSVTTTPLGKKE